METSNLTLKQRKFIAAYLEHFNGKEAAISAGYASPKQEAYRLLENPHIKQIINDELDAIREKNIGSKAVRLAKLNAMEEDLSSLQLARAEEMRQRKANGEVLPPGADSGLLLQTKKTFGSGKSAIVEDVWEIDRVMIQERQKIMEQAARETGDRDKRIELTGANGGPVQVEAAKSKFLELLDDEES